MKIIDLKTKRATFRPIKTPNSLELEYYRQLRKMVNYIHSEFKNIVIDGMDKEYIKKQIVDAGYINYVARLKLLLKEFNSVVAAGLDLKKINLITLQSVNSIYSYNERQWMKRLESFGIDLKKDVSYKFLKDYLQMRVNNNVSLIKNLRDSVSDDLEKMIYSNFENGKSFKELAKDMENRLGIDKRRAALIARNEIKNTNTQLTKKRMQEYGVEYAIWRNADDERVRGNPNGKYPNSKDNHWNLEGKIYQVGVGIWIESLGRYIEPGQEINCRCIAEPILETKEEILQVYSKEQTEYIRNAA